MKKTGIVILIIGVLIAVITGITFITKEKVVDIGEIQITRDKKHNLAWSPLIGVAVILAGGVVYFLGSRNKE
jgi:hypothetical protein